MPRYGNPERSSVLEPDTTYDLTKTFRSYTGNFTYDKQDSIILWGDLCGPQTYEDSVLHGSLTGHYLVGLDNSNSATRHGLFTPTTVTKLIDETSEFCGSKCSFKFTGIVGSLTSPNTGKFHASGHYFVVPDSDSLTFNDAGNDKPFSISLWYQSLAPNTGGSTAAAGPISYLINKPNEYGLAVSGDKKLRFQMSTGTGTNTIFVETPTEPMIAASLVGTELHGGLNHIVITYDGSETAAGMRVYLNGENITATTGGAGSYTGMTNGSGNLFFGSGAGTSGTSLPLGSSFGGAATLTEPSIWNAELSQDDIRAIYNASLTCQSKSSTSDSGYTSLPPRVKLRDLDNHPLSYPSVLRTGDRDRKGNFKISFDDTATLIFGNAIQDDFTNIRDTEIASSRIDKTKWSFSEGMEIRRETLQGFNGTTFQDGVLVFTGEGNFLRDRFIQTKQKVRNATITFDLVQGPHNQRVGESFLSQGLNLERGTSAEQLLVQISTHGVALGTWQTIKTFTPGLLTEFYSPGALDLERDPRYRRTFDTSGASDQGTFDEEYKAFRKKVVIPFSQINDPGEAYYVRIIQATHTGGEKAVWAIGTIRIESMNQDIRYPLLVDHDTAAGKRVAESFIATPHTRSDITAVGRTVSGISDTMLTFTPTEDVSPFNETLAIESLDSTNMFHSIGTFPQVLDGFSSRLADKTKFTLDISTYNSDYFGYTSGSGGQPPFPLGGSSQLPLMGYYNHTLKKWESIAKGYFWNCTNLFDHPFDSQNSIMHAVTSSAVGFGSFGYVATDDGFKFSRNAEDKSILNTYSRHITNFGFPFDGRYHATGSQTISATDLGITKPFLLEKIIFEFDGMFEYADPPGLYNSNAVDSAFQFKVLSGTNSERYTGRSSLYTIDPAYKYYLPTFFLLRQSKGYINGFKIKNKFDQAASNDSQVTGSLIGADSEGDYNVHIPDYYDLSGDGEKNAYVDTTRDLTAYGQLGILVSGSFNSGSISNDTGYVNIQKVLGNGMERNGLVKISPQYDSLPGDCSFTGSFRIGFAPEVTQQYDSATCTSVVLAMPSLSPSKFVSGTLLLDNKAPREIEASRRLVNNYPGFRDASLTLGGAPRTKTIKNLFTVQQPRSLIDGTEHLRQAKLSEERVNIPSPYVLMPGDDLVIGLQYPLAEDPVRLGTVNGKNRFQDKMKLHGPAKIHLYGSLISNKKEFHEYNNQNLTSDAIHEVIGAEKILDQFQTATRSELSGSYVDDWTTGTGYWQLNGALPSGAPWLDAQFVPPIHRIGLPIFSKVGTMNSAWMNNSTNFSQNIWPRTIKTNPSHQFVSGTSQKITRITRESPRATRFVQLRDKARRYVDSLYNLGTFIPHSSYGTMQTYATNVVGEDGSNNVNYRILPGIGTAAREWIDVVGGLSGSQVIVPGVDYSENPEGTWGQWRVADISGDAAYYIKKRHTRAAPKYYFNYRRFGHSFDMLEQAKDGRTVVPRTLFQGSPAQSRNMTPNAGLIYEIKFNEGDTPSGPGGTSFQNVSHLPEEFGPSPFNLQRVSTLATEADFSMRRVDSPVHVQYVSTGSSPGTSIIKFVKMTTPGEIAVLSSTARANAIFNVSTAMTSSYPFFEDNANPYTHKV